MQIINSIPEMLVDNAAMKQLADALDISTDHLELSKVSGKWSIRSDDKPIRVIQHLKNNEYGIYISAETSRQLTFHRKKLQKLGLAVILDDVLRLDGLPNEAQSTEIRKLLGKRSKRTKT